MTYHEAYAEAKRICKNADAGIIREHVAVQFNITDSAAGAFYLEVVNGRVYVEPYDYHDHDAMITGRAEDILNFLSHRLTIERALREGRLEMSGCYDKVERLNHIRLHS